MQVAKNSLVVGSIGELTADPFTAADARLSNFSSVGPTDDGRIKPDVVANGESLYSSIGSSDDAYGVFTGTSMATPR
jgi:subtilisin family serine protease